MLILGKKSFKINVFSILLKLIKEEQIEHKGNVKSKMEKKQKLMSEKSNKSSKLARLY